MVENLRFVCRLIYYDDLQLLITYCTRNVDGFQEHSPVKIDTMAMSFLDECSRLFLW